jgi:hypothetical protein
MLEKDIPANFKLSGSFFSVLARFAQMGVRQCQQLFALDAFAQVIKFLLGVDPEATTSTVASGDDNGNSEPSQEVKIRRRWTSLQSREFGELHRALAFLILSCKTDAIRDYQEMGKFKQELNCTSTSWYFYYQLVKLKNAKKYWKV